MKNRIKIVRNEIGISQTQFANDLGVSLSNIQSYETGRRNPSDAFIQLICNKYGINEAWLRSGEGEMKAELSREQEIAQITSQLFNEGEESFRYQLQLLISQMSEDQIELLKGIALKMAEIAEVGNKTKEE